MGKYIEREKLLEELEKIPAYFDSGDTRYGIEIAIDQTKKQPTADVVEVVRCKDCKHCEIWYPRKAKGEEPEIFHYCNALEYPTKPTDFCSCGELKELG